MRRGKVKIGWGEAPYEDPQRIIYVTPERIPVEIPERVDAPVEAPEPQKEKTQGFAR